MSSPSPSPSQSCTGEKILKTYEDQFQVAKTSCRLALGAVETAGIADTEEIQEIQNAWQTLYEARNTLQNASDIPGSQYETAYTNYFDTLKTVDASCINWYNKYNTYITDNYETLLSDATSPVPHERAPDNVVNKLIQEKITVFYKTQKTYLDNLETRLQEIYDYLVKLNIPFDLSGGNGNATLGSTTVLNLSPENVIFTSPQSLGSIGSGNINISGMPGNQILGFVIPQGADGIIGPIGPKGLTGLKGKPGKMGGQGAKGVAETPYQYYNTF